MSSSSSLTEKDDSMTRTFPAELGVEVFCALDSGDDVLALSATSRWWRSIWIKYASTIYQQTAYKSIEGATHAFTLQSKTSRSSQVTAEDFATIVRRSRFVKTIVEEFNNKVVGTAPMILAGRYGGRLSKRLTATERRRFIRTYYQLWTLLCLDEKALQSYAARLSMKAIYLLREMCWIPLPIGSDLPGPMMLQCFPHYRMYQNEGRRGEIGKILQKIVDKHERSDWGQRQSFEPCPWFDRKNRRSEGHAGFHFLWDHAQEELKNRSGVLLPTDEELFSNPIDECGRGLPWEESSDEE